MDSEKIIKPANGYLMVAITIALFILCVFYVLLNVHFAV